MKKILFVIDYYRPHQWGAENVYENIISRLADKGYHITILTSRFSKKLKKYEKEETKQNKNITIYRVGNSRKDFLRNAVLQGKKIIKKEDIDFIHTATYWGAIPAWILAKLFNKKVVLTVHEVFWKLWNNYKWTLWVLPYRCFEKIIFSLPFDYYHCVSRYTMNSIRLLYGIPDKKIKMIYNGIDNEFWDPNKVSNTEIKNFKKKHHIWTEKKYVGLYYGHSGKSKGLHYLIENILTLLKSDPELQFIFNIIDSKDSKTIITQLKEIQKKHKLQGQLLIFNGFPINELRTLIMSSDFVVAPSLAEWFGSVHSEVSRMGKILITTEVAAIPEVVFGKIKFIPPQQSFAILDAIKKIKKNEYQILPKKRFSWDDTVNKIEKLYLSLRY